MAELLLTQDHPTLVGRRHALRAPLGHGDHPVDAGAVPVAPEPGEMASVEAGVAVGVMVEDDLPGGDAMVLKPMVGGFDHVAPAAGRST